MVKKNKLKKVAKKTKKKSIPVHNDGGAIFVANPNCYQGKMTADVSGLMAWSEDGLPIYFTDWY